MMFKSEIKKVVALINEKNFIDYPKFFTPNNDGSNEYWHILSRKVS
jgi:transcription initiation factor IIE alpha subunit